MLRMGGDVDAIYTAAGLRRDSFIAQEHTLDEAQFYAVVDAARRAAKTEAFGLEIGLQFNLGSFGLISRAPFYYG